MRAMRVAVVGGADADFIKKMAALLEKEDAAYDIAGDRDAPSGSGTGAWRGRNHVVLLRRQEPGAAIQSRWALGEHWFCSIRADLATGSKLWRTDISRLRETDGEGAIR